MYKHCRLPDTTGMKQNIFSMGFTAKYPSVCHKQLKVKQKQHTTVCVS